MDRKFVYSLQSNQTFAAYAKVKKDVKDKIPPQIDKESLVYFDHDFKESCTIDRVYNIDLKSAYATILYKEEIISQDTFNYLSRLPKHDRLAAVGMLASKKKSFSFDRFGTIRTYEETISKLENFFYYAVQRTFEIMCELRAILGQDYLFTWVDGIYFRPSMEGLTRCEDHLRRIGFRYSEEVLTDWQVRVVKGAVKLFFVKDGKIKSFSLPAKESEFVSIMAEAMREKNVEKKVFDIGNKQKRQEIFNQIKNKSK